MLIKTYIEEDFNNYKVPALFIGVSHCGGKCCIESGIPMSVCINDKLRKSKDISVEDDFLINKYLSNPVTHAIVLGGLEPFEQTEEVLEFITKLRKYYHNNDDVVIYTGYREDEPQVSDHIPELKSLGNVIIKFGRFVPDDKPHFDEVLGVNLASDNQYAVKLS